MKYLFLLLLTVFLLVTPSCKFFREKGWFNKKAQALAMLKAQQDSVRVADSLRKVQEKMLLLENARLDSIQQAEERNRLADIPRYNIIVGSFVTPAYASSLAEEYGKMGYTTKILKVDGSQFELVAAESHKNFRAAVRRLDQFHDTVSIDAWIYIRK